MRLFNDFIQPFDVRLQALQLVKRGEDRVVDGKRASERGKASDGSQREASGASSGARLSAELRTQFGYLENQPWICLPNLWLGPGLRVQPLARLAYFL